MENAKVLFILTESSLRCVKRKSNVHNGTCYDLFKKVEEICYKLKKLKCKLKSGRKMCVYVYLLKYICRQKCF